jgi:hypothetical protein
MAALVSALLLTLVMAVPASAGGNGATQVSGIGFPDDPDPEKAACTELPFDYTIVMTGDLVGCVYGVVTSDKFGPSGVYKERADETFVGSYKGTYVGTFRMEEKFHAKYDLDSFDEIFGFCKHPIVKGSGTGDFEGVLGRLDFRDEVDDPANVSFPYKGHLRNLD